MKTCWLCSKKSETLRNKFVRPCKCNGAIEYIHKMCFIKHFQRSKSCVYCGHVYQVKIKNTKWLEICEMGILVWKYILFITGGIVFFVTTFLFLSTYGISVIYLTVGKDYFRENQTIVFCLSPLIFSLIFIGRLTGYHLFLHALSITVCRDLLNFEHFIISLLPFLFLLNRRYILLKILGVEMDSLFGNSMAFARSIGLYDRTTFLHGYYKIGWFIIPVGKILASLLTPYFSYAIGLFFKGDPILRSAFGCIVYFLCKQFLYLYYILKLKETIRKIKVIKV